MKAHLIISGLDVDAYELWAALAALVEPPPGHRIVDTNERVFRDPNAFWWVNGSGWRDRGMGGDAPLMWSVPIRTASLPPGERWLDSTETVMPGDRLACESPRMHARKMTTRELDSLARKGR